jgi:hypothetical protein
VGWGTKAQGANSLPQSFLRWHWAAGSLVKPAPARVTLDEYSGRQMTTDCGLLPTPGLWWSSWAEAPYSWPPG